MIKAFYLIFMLLITDISAFGQLRDRGIRQKVLKTEIIGKEYKFVHRDSTVTRLKYLGKAKVKDGSEYKILTSLWLWKFSSGATSRILIYNVANRYIGQYWVGMPYDLPNSLINNQLIFLNSDNWGDNCDIKLITRVDLSSGLPKNLFIKCKGNRGDIYPFFSSKDDD